MYVTQRILRVWSRTPHMVALSICLCSRHCTLAATGIKVYQNHTRSKDHCDRVIAGWTSLTSEPPKGHKVKVINAHTLVSPSYFLLLLIKAHFNLRDIKLHSPSSPSLHLPLLFLPLFLPISHPALLLLLFSQPSTSSLASSSSSGV